MSNQLARIIEEQRAQFVAVSCGAGVEFDREKGFAMQILSGNDYLCKIAIGNQNSLRAAIINTAAIGISLNPASKQAYLVQRKGAVCLDISYMGMMHIAQQCGAIQWGQAVIVRDKDTFELQPIGLAPIHKFNPFDPDRGAIVGCYVVVKTDTGDFLTNAMPLSKIYDIRERSEAWKSWIAKKTKCPWVTDEEEMIKKTVVKNASKYWPRRERLDAAVHHMNTDGGEGLALNWQQEKDVTPASADQQIAITDKLVAMGRTWEQLAAALKQMLKRDVAVVSDLTHDEAIRVLAFMEKKAA